MPSTYRTSNTNFVISESSTQAEILSINEQVIPQKNIEGFDVYAPSRNLHVYSVMSHDDQN